MISSNFKLRTRDSKDLYVYKWEPDGEKRAVIIVVHGMAEHAARYNDFAESLTSVGFVVYAHDQRGHGKTAGNIESLGYFDDHDGWNKVVGDIEELRVRAAEENNNLPIIMFGHSMGSLLLRTYLIDYSKNIRAAIVSGTTFLSPIMICFFELLIKIEKISKNKKEKSYLLDRMSLGSYNKKFRPNKTKFDWLSRDIEVGKAFENDPFCGTVFTVGFFADLVSGLKRIGSMTEINKVSKDLPIYFYSGEKCPLNVNNTAVMKVVEMFKSAGIKNIYSKIYKDGRHEMHNELNKREVYQDVINWINGLIEKQ